MKQQRRRFNKKEIEIVQNYINLFSHNLQHGFEIASIELKCKPMDIQHLWYRNLRNKNKIFITGTADSSYFNTKNVWRKKPRLEYKNDSGTINLMQCTLIFGKIK